MTSTIEFDGALPPAPDGCRIVSLRYRTCSGNLRFFVTQDESAHIDEYGMSNDSWWTVQSNDMPTRTFRLFDGTQSMNHLLAKYGFLDAQGCVNHKSFVGTYAPRTAPLHVDAHAPVRVPTALRHATGVPQFHVNSGICWYAAMCTIMCGSSTMRNFVKRFAPPDYHALLERCLFDRAAAQTMRNRLWYDYAIGDNVEDPPQMDGRNGCSEFGILCARWNIPAVRYRENGGALEPMPCACRDRLRRAVQLRLPQTLHQEHLLILRFDDGDHHNRYPLYRRMEHEGQRYRLVGTFNGQRRCGHQIGIACVGDDLDWHHFAIGDADLHKRGVGPCFVHFDNEFRTSSDWWKAWLNLVHVTKFGLNQEYCNLSPHNMPEDYLIGSKSKKAGMCSVDAIYLSERPKPTHAMSTRATPLHNVVDILR